ncbi:MAG: DUF2794 domain-containing protein [Rhizobiaceae bacterium]
MMDGMDDEASGNSDRLLEHSEYRHPAMDNIIHISPARSVPEQSSPASRNRQEEIISFDRRELDQILRVYGFKVADGEWRDYAIDMLKDRAVFSVFRRTSETPLFCIEKNPKLARKQGAYSITNSTGQVLKRGRDLSLVLRLFERRPKIASL